MSSVYSIGQMNELADALEADGFTTEDLKAAVSNGRLKAFREVVRGAAEIVVKKVEESVVSLLTLVESVVLGAVAGKKTRNCFTNKERYYYRDSDLDGWLPEYQPNQAESNFSIQQLAEDATFKLAVESYLGIIGDISTLAAILKEKKCITTLPAIEALIERQESGEDIGLRTDGWANFFFVEDKNEGVSVVRVYRVGRRWDVFVDRPGREDVWNAEHRFFFRN